MGWIMMSSKMDAEQNPVENKQDATDTDIVRVLQWGAACYFPEGIIVPAVTDENGSVITPASTRQPTGQEIHKAITDAIYSEIKNQVEAHERRIAADAAANQVQAIQLTPVS